MSRARLLLVLAGLLLLYPLFALRPYVTTKPYDVDEAYKVYSAILPAVGERPLVIGAETRATEICLQPLDAQSEKRPARTIHFVSVESRDLILAGVPVSTQLYHNDATHLVKVVKRFLGTG